MGETRPSAGRPGRFLAQGAGAGAGVAGPPPGRACLHVSVRAPLRRVRCSRTDVTPGSGRRRSGFGLRDGVSQFLASSRRSAFDLAESGAKFHAGIHGHGAVHSHGGIDRLKGGCGLQRDRRAPPEPPALA